MRSFYCPHGALCQFQATDVHIPLKISQSSKLPPDVLYLCDKLISCHREEYGAMLWYSSEGLGMRAWIPRPMRLQQTALLISMAELHSWQCVLTL